MSLTTSPEFDRPAPPPSTHALLALLLLRVWRLPSGHVRAQSGLSQRRTSVPHQQRLQNLQARDDRFAGMSAPHVSGSAEPHARRHPLPDPSCLLVCVSPALCAPNDKLWTHPPPSDAYLKGTFPLHTCGIAT